MADGLLTYRGVDIHRGPYTLSTIHFDLSMGIDDEAEVRGEDLIVPQVAGRIFQPRVKDRLLLELTGFVRGANRLDYRTLIDELHAIFDPTLAPGELVVGGGDEDYLGIPSGDSFSIDARYTGDAVWGPFRSHHFRSVSVIMEAIGSPPEWTPLGSS